MFAPHIIRRALAVELYHRKADRHYVAFLLNPNYGMEAPKCTIEVERKNKDKLFVPSQVAAMSETVSTKPPV